MGLKVGWTQKKKKNDEEKDGEKDGEKATPPNRDDLEAIGLSPSRSSSDVSIHDENGTYISHASIAEIKKSYGTIHEYLKHRYGPGKYTITVKGKGGEDTQHISIAGEEPQSPWLDGAPSPVPGVMDNNQLMGIYLTQQAEIARLKAEIDMTKNSSQQSMLGQIVPGVIDFIKSMMQSRPDTDLASVMTAATDCLKTLSEIKTPGEKSDDVGGLMSGIAQLVQGFQQRQPTPAYIPAPSPYPSPSYNMAAQPTMPQNVPLTVNSHPVRNPHHDETSLVMSSPTPAQAGLRQPLSSTPEATNSTDVFFENLIGMAEQKQAPKVIAEYLVQSIRKIPPQEIQKLDPQMQVLVGQLQANPVAAFDAICQFEPSLTDEKYTAEIKAELQKIVQ